MSANQQIKSVVAALERAEAAGFSLEAILQTVHARRDKAVRQRPLDDVYIGILVERENQREIQRRADIDALSRRMQSVL